MTITDLLVALIITQGRSVPNAAKIKKATKIITQRNTEQLTNKSTKIEANLDPDTKRAVTQAKEKGASSWFTVIPMRCNSLTVQQNVKRNSKPISIVVTIMT